MTTKAKSTPRPKAQRAQRKAASAKPAPKARRSPAEPVARGAKAPPPGATNGWGAVAVLGAAGAGVAALVYALGGKRASPRRSDDWPAHQVDGRNSSDQFAAQIADENMIPERVPEAII
ncbi:MAG: hypothetical protein K2X73_08865 [Sphingomonas sp.]|uniref:hypothetical protein n=1 Tax=Sphingomonas sp. TaxID=28214 RepID=UPI0025F34121|nr:hypothetical protein [Sphingomonas sp.]MBX9882070.1 hypothetical protein [Sphingomonas sp.]